MLRLKAGPVVCRSGIDCAQSKANSRESNCLGAYLVCTITLRCLMMRFKVMGLTHSHRRLSAGSQSIIVTCHQRVPS
jgi:hypothetical protein